MMATVTKIKMIKTNEANLTDGPMFWHSADGRIRGCVILDAGTDMLQLLYQKGGGFGVVYVYVSHSTILYARN